MAIILPDLGGSREVVSREQKRINAVRRKRRATERLVREPHRKLLVRSRLEATPDVLDIGRELLTVLLGHAHRHVSHGVRTSLVRRLERG